MKYYSYKDAPLRMFGLPDFDQNRELRRLPQHVIDAMEVEKRYADWLGRRIPGARIGFRTDSREIHIKLTFETLSPDVGVSIFGCQAVYVFVGPHKNARYLGNICPNGYTEKTFEGSKFKSNQMEDVMVWLPRNEIVANVEIGVDDDANVEAPTPYQYEPPVMFYGSSITEGGCCTSYFNAYNAVLSRRLDADYCCLGFSGAARGESEMARYIASLPMSVLVYDYDHNAPDVEHLQKTHEPFFKIIREARPHLPVIMMSRPFAGTNEDTEARARVVYKTYLHAKETGDENVYFIDGRNFFAGDDMDLCWLDTVHPNDLGMYRMALVIEPVLKGILEGKPIRKPILFHS